MSLATERFAPATPAPRPAEPGARPADHDLEGRARRERALAAAVILRAVEDYRAQSNGPDGREAWSFLTDARGGWKEAREEWCSLADIDPDALRERALAGQFGPPPEQAPPALTQAAVEDAIFFAIEDADLDWKSVSADAALAAVDKADLRQVNGRPFSRGAINDLLQSERRRVGLNNRGHPITTRD